MTSMSTDRPSAWYCLRAQTRREHLAAKHCLAMHGCPVFAPRIKIRRLMRNHQTKDFVEPLFPSYFFLYGEILPLVRSLLATPGVTGIVKTGGDYQPVPEKFIEELQAQLATPDTDPANLPPLEAGQAVTLLQGCLRGQPARIIRIEDPQERIAVLLEFLGREIEINVRPENIFPRR